MSNHSMVTRTFLRLLPVQIMLVAIASLNSVIDGLVASNCIGPLAMEAIAFEVSLPGKLKR